MNGAVIICYDIASNRRRRRVVRILLGYGERVLESVFVCRIPPAQLQQLQASLARIITEQDKLSYWQICGHDWQDRIWQGKALLVTQDESYFIY